MGAGAEGVRFGFRESQTGTAATTAMYLRSCVARGISRRDKPPLVIRFCVTSPV